MLKQAALACCKLYVSESRNAKTLEAIGKAAKGHPLSSLLNVFEDKDYNRVGYTLVSHLEHGISLSSPLQEAVLGMAKTALQYINLEEHGGTHPRLGVVDHICFHPLGEASLSQVASLACSVAAQIGTTLNVPTFLYGAAHHENRTLDSIRRELGYFKPNREGQWVGLASVPLSLSPEFGPCQVLPRTGVVVVGACPWVVNYNVPIVSSDLVIGRRIARKVSARGGGLPGVQAMALLHGDKVMEIACNLLDAKSVGPDKVQAEVSLLAEKEGLKSEQGYLTDYSEDQILEAACRRLKLF
ncbi:hypothetical protein SUGI_0429990 [Cryptomeria japonica]|uniref:uncharacterized protein LOC131047761 n=1 Tax=Cryptomeria japonica TaxID=3369 RepID=UPI002408CCA5|nr:uncharacterized protein LOC131047761 [Cryptomeria japonica]GLJ22813.1 hypothetical protein SUGI_0429990 [Cryptomeria japonica]